MVRGHGIGAVLLVALYILLMGGTTYVLADSTWTLSYYDDDEARQDSASLSPKPYSNLLQTSAC